MKRRSSDPSYSWLNATSDKNFVFDTKKPRVPAPPFNWRGKNLTGKKQSGKGF